jgi:hypothetical protein
MSTDDEAPAGEAGAPRNHVSGDEEENTRFVTLRELRELVSETQVFRDSTGVTYATVRMKGIQQTHVVTSREFASWTLIAAWERFDGRMASIRLIDELRAFLVGQAMLSPVPREVFVRVGHRGGRVYVDLGDADWRAVEIDSDGYRLVPHPPGLFIRPPGFGRLPEPIVGGRVHDLVSVLNVDHRDFDIVVIFLLGALRPRGPYPLLNFHGEQGSAKSTNSYVVKAVIDPSAVMLQGRSKEAHDLVVALKNKWLVAIDNMSSMTQAVADVLCCVATGAGASYNRKYTDDEEVLFNITRPVVFNGISDLAGYRPDLLDRSLRVQCPPIMDDNRRTEEDVLAELQGILPGVLGALYSAVASAIRRLPEVARLGLALPRLADVALWAEAAAPALGWDQGYASELMLGRRGANRAALLDTQPLTQPIVAFAKAAGPSGWEGTATDLLGLLKSRRDPLGILDDSLWPKQANRFSGQLDLLTPALRDRGVIITRRRTGPKGTRLISIHYEQNADDPVPILTGDAGPSGKVRTGVNAWFAAADEYNRQADGSKASTVVASPEVSDGTDDADDQLPVPSY